jgi:hypothetical protein
MKKIIGYSFIIIVNYFLITCLVFFFSYVSLKNNKVYDLFWIKSIQKKLYFSGLRNIYQTDKECVKFDKNLLYVPKKGTCLFLNSEFKTKLTFNEYYRENKSILDNNIDQSIAVLGDSLAMGWGVNDDETFSYVLEKKLNKKVFNFAVSSYGTIREIKRFKQLKNFDKFETIIIQYNVNDLTENTVSSYDKTYKINNFNVVTENKANNFLQKFKFILRNYKRSMRLFFADINDKIFKEKNLIYIDFNSHSKNLLKIIKENLNIKNKRIIIVFIEEPHMVLKNFPKNNKSFENIEFLNIPLDKKNFFVIDDHLNINGHIKIGQILFNYLNQ